MIYKAWSSIKEVPFCVSRSSIKFQGHTGQEIANFDPNWAFLDCNASFDSPVGLKWCTKLDVEQKRCPIVFRGYPTNFKITWTEKWMIWIQCWAKLLGWSQLSNPSDLPCFKYTHLITYFIYCFKELKCWWLYLLVCHEWLKYWCLYMLVCHQRMLWVTILKR